MATVQGPIVLVPELEPNWLGSSFRTITVLPVPARRKSNYLLAHFISLLLSPNSSSSLFHHHAPPPSNPLPITRPSPRSSSSHHRRTRRRSPTRSPRSSSSPYHRNSSPVTYPSPARHPQACRPSFSSKKETIFIFFFDDSRVGGGDLPDDTVLTCSHGLERWAYYILCLASYPSLGPHIMFVMHLHQH
ncbi:uncharacterized protein LOC120253894 [Dioscorea cayenensis subsp. rotundata]|uniref:Uncharacterized protein LOC120253894 n=1 Tax=Dioscorea cayennensis subsp. rotundata TaxID=55577 RepID=A0AB40AT52_DIOCR|nr:uncharacterized protein LOC120253894 [Dioscorea cayenensis subsp. rotundata]